MSAAYPYGSSFTRASLAAYLMLIVYASWYPFIGWRNPGVSPLAFLTTSLPRYWTVFDVATNIIGYIPFGVLCVFALHPKVRGAAALILTIMLGAALSAGMETVQNYLPSRVPSSLDLLSNIGGAAIGAVLGVWAARAFLEHSQLSSLRQRWIMVEGGAGLMVLALWPLAQIYPQGYLFGPGQLMPILSDWLSDWAATPIDLAAIVRHGVAPTVQQFWLSETIITACGLTGASLILLCMLRKTAPKGLLIAAMFAAAVIVKSLASALFFAPENAFVWLTPGTQGGLLIGILMSSGLAFARPVAQRRLAAICLLLSLAIINTMPANPYFIATLKGWVQGKFLNFNGAAQFLSLMWPFFALWFLWHPAHNPNPK
jgi:VanZ family protein